MSEDPRFAEISIAAALLYMMIFPRQDAFYEYTAHPIRIKSAIFPFLPDIKAEQVIEMLRDLESVKFIAIFTGPSGVLFMRILDYHEHNKGRVDVIKRREYGNIVNKLLYLKDIKLEELLMGKLLNAERIRNVFDTKRNEVEPLHNNTIQDNTSIQSKPGAKASVTESPKPDKQEGKVDEMYNEGNAGYIIEYFNKAKGGAHFRPETYKKRIDTFMKTNSLTDVRMVLDYLKGRRDELKKALDSISNTGTTFDVNTARTKLDKAEHFFKPDTVFRDKNFEDYRNSALSLRGIKPKTEPKAEPAVKPEDDKPLTKEETDSVNEGRAKLGLKPLPYSDENKQ